MSDNILNVSRRGFLQGLVSTGALVLSVRLVPEALWAAETAAGSHADRAVLHPSVFVGIDTDGTVYLVAARSEMGTSSRTSVPLILADELDADWKRVKIEQAIGDPRYGDQDTDGSHSVRDGFVTMREAGATARLMLTQAAAQKWGVPVSECESDLHVIVHKPSKRKAGYGELASAAAKLPVPKKEDLTYKPKSAWRYIGKGAVSYDLQNLCTGKAGFGMDAHLDGMVYASIEHPPVLGGKVKSYDEKAPLQVKGVKQTIPIKPFTPPHHFQPLGGVAVIADNTWAAFQGRKKLNVAWDNGPNASYNSDAIQEGVAGDCAQAGKGRAQYRRRGRRICQGWKDHGGGLLRAAPGARPHGAARRPGRLSRRQGYGVDFHAESAGGAGDRRRRARHSQRKRDLPRNSAGRRIRAQIETGLRGRGSDSVESRGQAGQGGVEPRRRHQVRLLSRRRRDVHEGCAGRKRKADGLAAAFRVSAHRFHLRPEHHLRRRRRTWDRAGPICPSTCPIIAPRTDRRKTMSASDGSARWQIFIMPSRRSPLPTNWRMPRDAIRWNICWS